MNKRTNNPYILFITIAILIFTFTIIDLIHHIDSFATEDTSPSLKRVASMRLSNVTFDLSVSGNYAYVTGVGSSGDDNIAAYLLEIYDISNPTQSKKVGELSMPDPIGFGWAIGIAKPGVYVKDNYAYVPSLAGGLYIIDVKEPKNPNIVGRIKSQAQILTGGVYVMNQYAYLLSQNKLQIVDVKDPRNPKNIGGVDVPEEPRGIYVTSDYAYVSAGWSGLQIVDIKDPKNPKIIGSAEYPGIAKSSYVIGKHAYVVGAKGTVQRRDEKGRIIGWNISGGRLQVVDISEPQKPKILGGIDRVHPNYDILYDVHVSGNHVYVLGSSGLIIVNISDPPNPKILAEAKIRMFIAEQNTAGIRVKGNYAYITDGLGIQVIDISNPQQPKSVGGVHGYTALGVQVIGNYAYVTDMFNTLVVIDISDPKSPKIVGDANISSLSVQGRIDIEVRDKYAYLLDRKNGLRIIDVSIPTRPTVIGNLQLPNAEDIQVIGDYVYITTGQNIQVIDIKDPKNPGIVSKLELPAYSLYVRGDYAYVAVRSGSWIDDLQVTEIKDPQKPKVVNSIAPSKNENITSVYVMGDYAYVGVGGRGKLHLIDVSEPKNLKVVSTLNVIAPRHIQVIDNLAFIGSKAELQMMDISEPQNPKLVSGVGIFGYMSDLYYANGYLYVAGGYELDIFQVEGLAQPQPVPVESQGKLPTTLGQVKQTALLQNYPNPFNHETWISFALQEATEVEIRIYDVSGKQVRTLKLGQKASGKYQNKDKAAYWDGRNDAEESVSSGIYFYKMRTGKDTIPYIRKAMLLK